MAPNRGWWLLLPESVRRFPSDLFAVISLIVLTILAVSVPGLRETPIRILLGLPFLLFLPGYAFVAALFPEASELPGADNEAIDNDHEIKLIERIALSFGMSIAIVPLLGVVLNFTSWGIRLTPVVLSVSAFTIGCTGIATLRRWELPPEKRFSVPYREWIAAGQVEFFEPDDRTDAALNIVLALSLLFALGSVGFAVAVPQDSEQFTEFYLLTEDDDGELVADGYPEEFVQGEAKPLMVGIENNEHETVEYTIVVQLERVEGDEEESEVVERDELDRFSGTLEHQETWHRKYRIVPTIAGERLRLTFLLYTGDVPEEPTRENSYQDLHLWINVE